MEIFPIMVDVNSNLRTVNFFLVKTEHSLTLIDAGWNNEDSNREFQMILQKNGFSIGDLTEIVLTHNHPDHVGLVNRITAEHSIPVYAHKDAIPRLKRDRDFLEIRVDFFVKLYEEMGCGEAGDKRVAYLKESIEKNNNQSIQADIIPIRKEHSGFSVMEVPGHSPDQIALFNRIDGELFGGDLLIEHISSNAIVEPDFLGKRLPTLSQHRESLEKVRQLHVNRVYPGHGVVIEKPDELLSKRIAGIERKAEKLNELIKKGHTTGSEIAQSFYKKSYHTQFSLVMSEIIGHLDYLEMNHQITKEMKEGVWHYTVTQ